jgi:hypothetical protein
MSTIGRNKPWSAAAALDKWRDEEFLYRAIRDYYDGAFSSGRWTSDFGTISLSTNTDQLAV